MNKFVCNLCGKDSDFSGAKLDREQPSCSSCGSNVRTRGLLQALSLELFGVNLALPDFPRVKSLRGLGLSDANQYAVPLAEKFDYRNTFYDRLPRFDITAPEEHEFEKYDFLLSSEVFEHVLPPAETAFRNARRLLKATGVLVFTVPYSVEPAMLDHYADIHEFGFAQVGGRVLLINRNRAGEVQIFENPVFHIGCAGQALEMREFSETGLSAMLTGAGFSEIRIYSDDYPPFGIIRSESWSLPIAARKGTFTFNRDATRDVLEEWRDLKHKFSAEMKRLDRAVWCRVGRRLGLL